ncbi:MAG: hypothetical protein ACLP3R_23020 [Candidatus Korobacteraceae bacterium]
MKLTSAAFGGWVGLALPVALLFGVVWLAFGAGRKGVGEERAKAAL